MLSQVSQTVLACSISSVEQRLARWLLMCQDRVGDELSIVQDFLSLMLHVRRPSVTLALKSLEAAGSVKTARGRLSILDRTHLLQLAGNTYGFVEAERAALFGFAAADVASLPETGAPRSREPSGGAVRPE